MSSIHARNGYTYYNGDKAVDGIYLPIGIAETGSLAHTVASGTQSAWWRVDLEQEYCIWGVNILNRAYVGKSLYRAYIKLLTISSST